MVKPFDWESLEMLGRALLPRRWIFAKTMPRNPHWYTLRREWGDDALFNEVVAMMRRISYTEYFWGKPYQMVNINGYKYWTMGAPIQETILINRKPLSLVADYDQIAGVYDGLFTDPASLQENAEVIRLLDYQGGSVLDIGCGTGLLLDYVKPDGYVGIDPSGEMLRRLWAKHPECGPGLPLVEVFADEQGEYPPTLSHRTVQTRFEEYVGPSVDLVVSLFGAASYIAPEAVGRIPQMVNPGGGWFVMFYQEEYSPVTYERAAAVLVPAATKPVQLHSYGGNHLLLPGERFRFGNYWIVRGWR